MTESKKHVEDLNIRSELLSLELYELNDDIGRKEKTLNELKQTLRKHQDESSKLCKEKEMLQNKLQSLEPMVNEKMELMEELESQNILNEEEMSTVMKESLDDLEQQAIAIQKEVDEKRKELNSLNHKAM